MSIQESPLYWSGMQTLHGYSMIFREPKKIRTEKRHSVNRLYLREYLSDSSEPGCKLYLRFKRFPMVLSVGTPDPIYHLPHVLHVCYTRVTQNPTRFCAESTRGQALNQLYLSPRVLNRFSSTRAQNRSTLRFSWRISRASRNPWKLFCQGPRV